MKKFIGLAIILVLGIGVFVGCSSKEIDLTSTQLQDLTFKTNKLDYSHITQDGNDYNIELTYHNQLTVGEVSRIKNIIENNFNKDNSKINLEIQQFKPMASFNYVCEDGAWTSSSK